MKNFAVGYATWSLGLPRVMPRASKKQYRAGIPRRYAVQMGAS